MSSRPLTKLYIAKFGNTVGRREIEDAFGKYGELYSCNVNSREGYATVSYKYQEQAEKAIQKLNGSDQLGGNLLVEHTLKKSRDGDYSRPDRRSDRYGGSSSNYRDRDQGNSRGGSSRYGERERSDRNGGDRDRDREREGSLRRGGSSNGGHRDRGDKDRFIKDGLCFNCGGQGHISRKCPEARNGGRSSTRGPGMRSDRERRPYRERSRSYDRNKGKSSRKDGSRSRSPYDSRDKDRKRRSKKSSRRSNSSSSHSNKSNSKSRKDRKRSNSSSQSSNSNSSRSGSISNRKQSSNINSSNNNNASNGSEKQHLNGNSNDQQKKEHSQ